MPDAVPDAMPDAASSRGPDGIDLAAITAAWPDPQACVVVVGADGADGADHVLASCGDAKAPRRWASVTKLLTALTVLASVRAGTVSMDEQVGPPGATLSHLLDHSSGLSPEGDRTVAAVGTRRVYSNGGYEVAAAHVETRSGVAFADLVADEVLDVVDMPGCALDGSPAHGLLGPCRDLAALAADLLSPRRLEHDDVEALSTPSRPGLAGVLPGFGRQEPNDWGLGAEIRGTKSPHWTAPAAPPTTFGHFGQSGTFLWVDRSAGLACVSASREPFGAWATDCWPSLAHAVLDAFGPPTN